ncbi:MAG: TonB-dependent receptor, partial [Halioglobus sp.]|nr:TonB-dependent receptor [Halioglobus sp.]
IRGVGSRSAKTVAIDPAVGVYVDGLFIPRSDAQLLQVVDAESIQVLRGPQGTLFGKNTAGGAILVTTTKPDTEFGGDVSLDVGNYDRRNLRAVLNIPFSDAIQSRFTIDSRERDGYMDDAETGIEYGDEDKLAILGQFSWQITDNLAADLLALYSEQDERTVPETCELVNEGTVLQGFVAPGDVRTGPEACADSLQLERRDKVILDRRGVNWEMESTMLGLTLEWDIGDLLFKSITGWLSQDDINNWRDQDAGPVFSINNTELLVEQLELNGIDADEEREFFSQELQLNGSAFDDNLDYTVGLFASTEEIDRSPTPALVSDSGFLGFQSGDAFVALPPGRAGFRQASLTSYENTSWAAFAQASYYFNPQWTLTAGGRYGVEDKEIEQFNYTSATPAPAGPLSREEWDALQGTVHDVVPNADIPFLEEQDDWRDFTPSATLSYTADDDVLSSAALDTLLVYGTWSEGFKAGGFSRLDETFQSFDPENVTNYELGIKIDALDRKLRLNIALFYMDYEDMQVTITRALGLDEDDVRVGVGIANAGEATMQGVEFELSYLPNEHWLFTFSADYLDAEYDEFTDLARNLDTQQFEEVDRSSEDFAYVPETTFSASAEYRLGGEWGDWAARLAYFYKDEIFIALSPGLEDLDGAYLDDYELWNARLSWLSPDDGRVELALYCDNLTDEDYYGTGNIEFENQGTRSLVNSIGRTYGLQASYRF